jgi:hypothetical protein
MTPLAVQRGENRADCKGGEALSPIDVTCRRHGLSEMHEDKKYSPQI